MEMRAGKFLLKKVEDKKARKKNLVKVTLMRRQRVEQKHPVGPMGLVKTTSILMTLVILHTNVTPNVTPRLLQIKVNALQITEALGAWGPGGLTRFDLFKTRLG